MHSPHLHVGVLSAPFAVKRGGGKLQDQDQKDLTTYFRQREEQTGGHWLASPRVKFIRGRAGWCGVNNLHSWRVGESNAFKWMGHLSSYVAGNIFSYLSASGSRRHRKIRRKEIPTLLCVYATNLLFSSLPNHFVVDHQRSVFVLFKTK